MNKIKFTISDYRNRLPYLLPSNNHSHSHTTWNYSSVLSESPLTMYESLVEAGMASNASNATLDDEDWTCSSSLWFLHNHDCLLPILEFLPWQDLNNFAISSKKCYQVRNHHWLDQTRSGTIQLGNSRVSSAMEFMDRIRERHWSQAFCGRRTHLRLTGLTNLSSGSDEIDFNRIASLKEVTSLDCSIIPKQARRILTTYVEYIDKAFSLGLALSLIVPNLREIDMSHVPLTSIAVAWLAENNPNLVIIRWNRSLIWPINNECCDHIKACQHLEELYLDDCRMLLSHEDLDPDLLWTCYSSSIKKLRRVSLRKAKWYRKGSFCPVPQEALLKFVRCTPSLKWFRSDLTIENVATLQKERPDLTFCA